jgi:hypothetical protein
MQKLTAFVSKFSIQMSQIPNYLTFLDGLPYFPAFRCTEFAEVQTLKHSLLVKFWLGRLGALEKCISAAIACG